jgi:hypothetical protein
MKRTTNLPTGLAALPPKVRARLENPPNPGTGVHPWIFSCALAMLRFLPEADATDLLKECLPRDPSPANEVERQVQAAAHIIESGQTGTPGRRRPEFPMHLGSPAKVLELAEGRINLDCLRSLSPVAKTAEIPTVDVLRALFPDNPLICAGQFFHRALTQPLNDFHPRFLSRCSFVVPNGTRWREDEFKSKPAEELAPQRLEYFDPNYLNHKQDNEQ